MFGADELNKAISSALNSAQVQVPPGKKVALMAVAHADGTVQGAVAFKEGDHWTFGGEVEMHQKQFQAGVSVAASW